MTMSIVDLYSA